MLLVGNGSAMVALRDRIAKVAPSNAKVLILGPTGAGKELVAREIHRRSVRADRPLVTVNCAAFTESLLETELFGHAKGSFTGAVRDQKGKIEIAHRGTLFLDEVGDMSLRTQGLILRFLESGEIQPVGVPHARPLDVRVIAATSVDLKKAVVDKEFRRDLYYRLKVAEIRVPSLAEHPEDVLDIIHHFENVLGNGNGHKPLSFTKEALDALQQHSWPGTVRELRNLVENLLIEHSQSQISISDLAMDADEIGVVSKPSSVGDPDLSPGAKECIRLMMEDGRSFWDVVHTPFMARRLLQSDVLGVVIYGLEQSKGMYKGTLKMYNMPLTDYKRWLNFLRKHDCQPDFAKFR